MTDDLEENVARRRLIGAGLGVVGGVAALGALSQPAHAAASDAEFWSYGPQRVVDSRNGTGTTTGKISGGQTRTISLANIFISGVSLTAIVNLTLTQTENSGYLTVWQSDLTRPGISNINWFGTGQALGNLAVVGLRSNPVSFNVYCGGLSGRTHFLVDLVGYFYKDGLARVRPPAEKRLPE